MILLAAAGVAAALLRLAHWVYRAARSGTEVLVAAESARARAQHGDVTGMQEAVERADAARGRRSRAVLAAVAWLVLVVLPALTPWVREIYAAYSLLWLVSLLERARAPDGGTERKAE